MTHDFEVAFSFAGEQREYVEQVALPLKAAGIRVFYDRFEEEQLWGKDLATHFSELYQKRARYCVAFISSHYVNKPWTRHEFRAALARSLNESSGYILPVRFDDSDLPGLLPTIGYISATRYSPTDLAQLILRRLGDAGVAGPIASLPAPTPAAPPPSAAPSAPSRGHTEEEVDAFILGQLPHRHDVLHELELRDLALDFGFSRSELHDGVERLHAARQLRVWQNGPKRATVTRVAPFPAAPPYLAPNSSPTSTSCAPRSSCGGSRPWPSVVPETISSSSE